MDKSKPDFEIGVKTLLKLIELKETQISKLASLYTGAAGLVDTKTFEGYLEELRKLQVEARGLRGAYDKIVGDDHWRYAEYD